jgi:hypothetical protein
MTPALPLQIGLGLIALLLSSAAVLLAHRPPTPRHPASAGALLMVLDDDGDGSVGPDEYARHSDGELPLAVLDADGSGALELWELDLALSSISPLQPQRNLLPRVR